MKIVVSIVLGIALFQSLSASAAWTEQARIDYLKVHSQGVDVRLKGFENTSAEVACSDTRTFVLVNDESQIYDTKVSFLLSAFMSKTPVNLSYYGCYEDRIRLYSVIIRD
ncbi:hypothetical protein ACJJIC_09745 [Microbulbifer sp. ANSA002]|uniref:hypothetical protein n=1 Tax=unclassified Microbulbifer TaxID=2619833 RepID=UPI004042EFD1